jgi:hypothetical protein
MSEKECSARADQNSLSTLILPAFPVSLTISKRVLYEVLFIHLAYVGRGEVTSLERFELWGLVFENAIENAITIDVDRASR